MNKIIAILGGSLVKDKNTDKWRTAHPGEGDEFGITVDRLRIEAVQILYNQQKGVQIIVLGGQGQYEQADFPAVAGVIKSELIELGMPGSLIMTEEKSGSTHQQLKALQQIIIDLKINSVELITNKYHLPRVQAMIEHSQQLSILKKLFSKKQISLESAEDVLIQDQPDKWQEVIDKVYQGEAMKKRLALEAQGVAQIKSGTYKLQ